MNKIRTLLLAAMMLVVTCATSFAAMQDFTFVNSSNEVITAIHLIPKDDPGDRGNNLVAGEPLRPGESIKITFDWGDKQKFWAIDVDTADGGTGDSLDYFDLSTTYKITYTNHWYVLN